MNNLSKTLLVVLCGAISGGGAAIATDTKGERIAALEAQASDAKDRLVRIEDKLDRLMERK